MNRHTTRLIKLIRLVICVGIVFCGTQELISQNERPGEEGNPSVSSPDENDSSSPTLQKEPKESGKKNQKDKEKVEETAKEVVRLEDKLTYSFSKTSHIVSQEIVENTNLSLENICDQLMMEVDYLKSTGAAVRKINILLHHNPKVSKLAKAELPSVIAYGDTNEKKGPPIIYGLWSDGEPIVDGNKSMASAGLTSSAIELEVLKLDQIRNYISSQEGWGFLDSKINIFLDERRNIKTPELSYEIMIAPLDEKRLAEIAKAKTLAAKPQKPYINFVFEKVADNKFFAETKNEYELLENVSSQGDSSSMTFSYANYETDYTGVREVEKIATAINNIMAGVKEEGGVFTKLTLKTSSFESKEYFDFLAAASFDSGKPLAIEYLFDHKAEKKTIKKGKITILDQELLKMWEVKQLLDPNGLLEYTIELILDENLDENRTDIILNYK